MTGRLRTLEEIGDGWERAVDFVEMCRAQAWCLDVDADAAIVALLRLYKATAADKFRAV